MPEPAKAIPFERSIEIHKLHASEETVKNGACEAQVEAPIIQKLVKGVPSNPHRASKCSQMEPWGHQIGLHFEHLRRLWPTFPEDCSRHAVLTPKRPCQPTVIGQLSSLGCAFEATAGLGWISWVCFASLSEIIVRWAAAAVPSKSLGGLYIYIYIYIYLHMYIYDGDQRIYI